MSAQRFPLLLLAGLLAAAVIVACGDDSEPTRTPTISNTSNPTVTTTPNAAATAPPVATCPVHEDICAHAGQLAAALRAGDVDSVVGTTRGQPVTCPAVLEQLAFESPLCIGAQAGEVRYGIRAGRYQSEGGTLTVDAAKEMLLRTLERIPYPRAYTVGCRRDADPACDNAYALVFTDPVISTEVGGSWLLKLVFLRAEGAMPELASQHEGTARFNPELVNGGEFDFGVIFGRRESADFVPLDVN